ncbi:TPA: HAD family phosphatase [Enterococcus faecium]|uniref:HAD family hydrolase n=1 Tax=Enterococcus faecium TaxID=1352 RepID=UPI0005340968|nr:HAD family phosphatase [Enterococcus faecium]EME3530689.1 HAD family phosphatase [Enterococcus faecium]OSP79729.1 haloacid dehalogenase [Enterococcus faecium]HAZ0646035.1 HAD family phosphatase [Enterococcus faecium]
MSVDSKNSYKREGWLWGFQQFDIHIPKEIVDAWGGKNWKQSFDILVKAAGSPEKVQEVRAKREEYFYQQLTSGAIHLKPYAKEILADLKERHMKLGIATTTVTKRATDILDHFKLADYFDTFTFGDEVSENKPSPIPYLTALERTGLGVVLIPDSSFVRNYTVEEKEKLKLLAEGKDLRTVIEMLNKKTEK